nr:hypothetical protein [Parachlamydiaceae bacterium]
MNSTTKSLSENLDRLNELLKLIDFPADKSQSDAMQPIRELLSSIDFKNDKMASKIVKFYVFKTDATQKNSEKTAKYHQIYTDLIKLCNQKTYLDGVESCWITDESVDKLPNFHRIKKMKNDPIPSKMVFHIHANEFGANNQSLEGYTSAATLEYLYSYLCKRTDQELPIYGLSKETLDSIANALEFAKNFTGLEEKIANAFDSNQPLLLPGGWSGAPSGHAMYYEIIPESKEKATFRLFNLGAGSNLHFGGIVGNKTKRLPHIDFTGVSKAILLNSNVIKALKELQENAFFPGTKDKTEYNEGDIYQGLKALLSPEGIETYESKASIESLKTTQYSGICAWRSLMAFLSTKMSKADYKLFICDIKLQSLIDKISRCQNEVFSKAEWHLLKKSHQKLSRTIVKAFENAVIGKQYALYACAKVHKISKTIEKKKDQSFKPNLIEIKPKKKIGKSQRVKKELIHEATPPLNEQINNLEGAINLQPCTFLYHKIKELNVEKIANAFKELLSIAKVALQNKEHHALNISLIDLMCRLDSRILIESLKDNPEGAKEAMEDLGKLSKIFFETCLRVPEAYLIHPDRIFALTKLLYLQQQLAMIVEPEHLKNVSFALDSTKFAQLLEINAIDFFFQLSDAHMNHEFYKMEMCLTRPNFNDSYFETYSFNNDRDLSNSSNLTFKFKDLQQILQGSINSNIQKMFPTLLQQLKDEDPQFASLHTPQQSARIYASDRLPEWFKALRDTHLYLLQIKFDCIANPPTAEIDCSLQFDVFIFNHHQRHEGVVYFCLKGLSGDLINQYPEVKRIRERPESRYEGLFRPFKCLELSKIFEHLQQDHKKNNEFSLYSVKISREKELFADHVSNHSGLSDESFKELRHIFLNKEIRIPETFSYFVKYPAKLSDPDYQTIFALSMFQGKELYNALSIPGFADWAENFIQGLIDRHMKEENIQATVFLLRISRIFKGYSSKEMRKQKELEKIQKELEERGLQVRVYKTINESLDFEKFKEFGRLIWNEEKIKESGGSEEDIKKLTAYFEEHKIGPEELLTIYAKLEEMYLEIERKVSEVLKELENLKELGDETIKGLKLLLEKKGLEIEEKSVIYAELIASLSKKKQLGLNEVFELLAGTAFLQENPVQAKWSCPQTNKEVRDAIHIHAKSIHSGLIDSLGKPNVGLLNSLALNLKGQEEQSWEVVEVMGEFPHFISNGEPSITYFPLIGRFVKKDSKVLLPTDIRQHPHFRQLFKEVNESSAKGANLYEFTSSSGFKTLLRKQGDVLIIEQLRGADWYRFIPREAFLKKNDYRKKPLKSILRSRHLVHNFNHWQAIKGSNIIIVDPTLDKCFAIAYSDWFGVEYIERSSDRLFLGKAQSMLKNIEESSFIHEWYQEQDGQLKEIELPRFGLSFTYDSNQSRIYADQFAEEGYFLSAEQYIPTLGAFTHFLLIENDAGQKKALIPNQWLQKLSSSPDQEALSPKYSIDQNLAPEKAFKQSYSLFTVNSEGKLVSESKKANLFLAYILSAMQEYEQAAELLRKHAPKLNRYNKDEEILLTNIIALGKITGDHSGNGIAARLYASYLLIKNQADHKHTVDEKLKKNLVPLLNDYLSHYCNITDLKLTKQEETFLVKFALNEKYDTKFFIRLAELDSDYVKHYL